MVVTVKRTKGLECVPYVQIISDTARPECAVYHTTFNTCDCLGQLIVVIGTKERIPVNPRQ